MLATRGHHNLCRSWKPSHQTLPSEFVLGGSNLAGQKMNTSSRFPFFFYVILLDIFSLVFICILQVNLKNKAEEMSHAASSSSKRIGDREWKHNEIEEIIPTSSSCPKHHAVLEVTSPSCKDIKVYGDYKSWCLLWDAKCLHGACFPFGLNIEKYQYRAVKSHGKRYGRTFLNVESFLMFSVVCGSMGKRKNVQRKQGNCFLPHNIENRGAVQYLAHRKGRLPVKTRLIPPPPPISYGY